MDNIKNNISYQELLRDDSNDKNKDILNKNQNKNSMMNYNYIIKMMDKQLKTIMIIPIII